MKKFSEFNKINESSESDMQTIKIVVGDWSDDGHGKTRSFNILSNLNTSEINEAYKKGCELIKYDGGKGIKDFCRDYEDSEIPKDFAQALEDAFYGLPGDVFKADDLEESWGRKKETHYNIDESTYVDIYLKTVLLGNNNFLWKYNNSSSTLNIGGYGFFY